MPSLAMIVVLATGLAGHVYGSAQALAASSATRAEGADADTEARNRIVEAVEKKYGARVVRVNTEVVDGRKVYELRLLSGERIWMVRVDAETGRELPAKN